MMSGLRIALLRIRRTASDSDEETTWIRGRQLGFLIDIPETTESPLLEFTLRLPEWIQAQSFTVNINGSETGNYHDLVFSEGSWQTVSVPLDSEWVKPGRNFLAVLFDNTYSPSEELNWQVSAELKSIRISDLPPTSESDPRHQ